MISLQVRRAYFCLMQAAHPFFLASPAASLRRPMDKKSMQKNQGLHLLAYSLLEKGKNHRFLKTPFSVRLVLLSAEAQILTNESKDGLRLLLFEAN